MTRVCIAVAILGTGSFAFGQDDEPSENGAKFSVLSKKMAAEYEISVDGTPLKLKQESLLRWTNPAVGEIYGDVYVWADDGRPAAIASVYRWYRPYDHMTHEFQSLSTGPLRATRDGQPDWATQDPGLKWQPLTDVPAPRATPTARLVQLRQLARLFTARIVEKDQTVSELRLVPQPLVRYTSDKWKVTDGAMFSFAKGTDPEALLLLEVRDGASGPAWFYAIARSNNQPLKASLRDEEVWSVKHLSSSASGSHRQAFTKYIFLASGELK